MLGLYLHIPFCQAICNYCNFNRGLLDPALKGRYVAALAREIRDAGDHRPADTIFFGGGTPSLLDPDEVAELIAVCRDVYRLSDDAEITLETNPETVTRERLAAFRQAGVNRISFGVQTFDDDELRRLGRIHTVARVREVVAAAREAGIANLSLDLMYWLPGQSRESWRRSIACAIGLEPDHLSLYALELYPNAPLREAMARATAGPVPASGWRQESDDVAADMYLEAFARLDEVGYRQYQISNTARPGAASRHNLKYWTSGDWRGFGCGAHSTVEGRRWQNIAATADYTDRIERGIAVDVGARVLGLVERREEALFTGLRLATGIDRPTFLAVHGIDPWEHYRDGLNGALEAGLIWLHDDAFGLTRPGMLMANEIMTTFVA